MADITIDPFSGETAGTLLENHTGTQGAVWTKYSPYNTGSMVITDDGWVRINGTNTGCYYASGTPGDPNAIQIVQWRMKFDGVTGSTGPGRTGMGTGLDPTLGTGVVAPMFVYRTNQGWQLLKLTGGSTSQIGTTTVTTPSPVNGSDFLCRMEWNPSTGQVWGYVDNNLVLTDTDATLTAKSNGRTFIFSPGAATTTDNQSVQFDEVNSSDNSTPSANLDVRNPSNVTIPDNGTAYAFGNVGEDSVQTVELTLRNAGNAILTFHATTPFTFTNTSLVSGPSAGSTLAIGATTTLTIQIDTGTTGAYTGNVSIATDDPDSPYIVNFSATVVEGVPPAVPTGLNATPGDYQVALTWNANGEGDLASYRVYRSTDNTTFSLVQTVLTGTTTWTNTGLTAGQIYYYKIAARDVNNNESAQSTSVNATPTGVPTPSNFTSTGANNSLVLSWDSVGGVSEYRVWANGVRVYTGLSTNPTITGLENGKGYDLRLSAVSSGGTESPPAFASGFPSNGSSVPNAPSNCTSARHAGRIINVAWDRTGVTGETNIVLERNSSADSRWRVITNLPARHNQYQDNIATTDGTTYQYRVRAVGLGGSSTPSAASTALAPNVYSASFSAPTVSVVVDSAFQITVNYTNPTYTGGGALWWMELSENDQLVYTITPWGRSPGTSGGSSSYVYPYMKPGTRCRVRVFIATGLGASQYGYSQAFEMPARPGPKEPTNITYDQPDNSSAVISWTDTNGGAAQYEVELALLDPNGTIINSTFSVAATTVAGATTATLSSLTPERGYFVRVRALQGGLRSGYGPRGTPDGLTHTYYDSDIPVYGEPYLHFVTPRYSARTTPITVNFGPGQTQTDWNTYDLTTLQPGDTLRIHCNTDGGGNRIPYVTKLLLNIRGLPTKKITIIGVPHPITGELPLFSFDGAVTPTWAIVSGGLDANSHMGSAGRLSGFYISSFSTGSNGYMPGFFDIGGLEVIDCEMDLPFTFADGTPSTYSRGCSPFRFRKGSHVTIHNCIIRDNGNGMFGTSRGNENDMVGDLFILNNYFDNNGTTGSDLDHHSYFEGLRVTYEGNYYGPVKPNTGSGLKDRSAGTIVRYNWLEDGGHHLDLCESQDAPALLSSSPWYQNSWVAGNVFAQVEGRSNTLNREIINTHDDHNGPPTGGRSIYFRFYHNTVVVIDDRDDYVHHASTENTWGCIEFRNNVMFSRQPLSATTSSVRMVLGKNPAFGWTGKNWLSPGHGEAEATNTGRIHGYASNTITTTANAVGFIDQTGLNFRLLETSPLIGQVTEDLPPDFPTVEYELETIPPTGIPSLVVRSNLNDLGAFGAEIEVPASLRDAIVNLVVDSIDAGTTNPQGRLQLLNASDVVLISIPLSNPAFGNSENGTATANTITTTNVTTGGTVTKFRFVDRNNAVVLSGTVSGVGGGGDMIISNVNLAVGDPIITNPGTYTGPE